ncbi:hypothetical protein D770_10110 [Flammeovirgaceae bacterium 311]|nr:hypothetical protein D770_10110 [Flammeovirgaceae bacterium 311]
MSGAGSSKFIVVAFAAAKGFFHKFYSGRAHFRLLAVSPIYVCLLLGLKARPQRKTASAIYQLQAPMEKIYLETQNHSFMKAQIFSVVLLIVSYSLGVKAQGQNRSDSLSAYFQEIEAAAHQHQKLWDHNLYGPLLLVDPSSRNLWANEPDSAGHLIKEGSVYSGRLPAEVNVANTALQWSGKRWAMLMLPLPTDKAARNHLLAHELFHRAQLGLGFKVHSPANDHLDKMEGRMYLRLELEALKEALTAQDTNIRREHLSNAYLFRRYRQSLYPAADTTENLLELNEGLAEYTGLMMSGRSREKMQQHLLQYQHQFLQNPSYVRSFAYQTIPAWGFLLAQQDQHWNRQISAQTQLTSFFRKAFNLQQPVITPEAVQRIAGQYGGAQILAEEKEREIRLQLQLQEYTRRFVEEPHLDIPFQNMSISFDPGNLVPLPGKGTVYPNLRVTDVWGILTVAEGALISQDWSKVTISQPSQISEERVRGRGWTLELKEGYRVVQDTASQHYTIVK